MPLIVSHMFVFYFGIMADLTPPVALAALAASPIAGASHMKIGLRVRRASRSPAIVVPFMAVYAPALMLQSGDGLERIDRPDPRRRLLFVKAVIAIGLWGARRHRLSAGTADLARAGFSRLRRPASSVVALPLTDEIGFVLTGTVRCLALATGPLAGSRFA